MSAYTELMNARADYMYSHGDAPTIVKMSPRTHDDLLEDDRFRLSRAATVAGMEIVEVYPLADDVFQFEGKVNA